MVKTAPPARPTAINLSDPGTYNARALASFNYVQAVANWIAGLDATDYLDVVGAFGGAKNPIMERGTNANGNYFRFANKLQICFILTFRVGGSTTPEGAVFRSTDYTWNFPASFATAPFIAGAGGHRGKWAGISETTLFRADVRSYSALSDPTPRIMSFLAAGFFEANP